MLLLLLACKGSSDLDTSCDAQVGLVYGVVRDAAGPVEGAHLYFWQDPTEIIQELTDAQGVYALELTAGEWTYNVETPDGSETTDEHSLSVERCGEHEVLVHLEPC